MDSTYRYYILIVLIFIFLVVAIWLISHTGRNSFNGKYQRRRGDLGYRRRYGLVWKTDFSGPIEQRGKIDNELLTARPALQRALIIAGGYGRLARLDKELQCIQRASLDYRNVFAVVAETSSCLPRNWGAKDPLRDTRYLFN